MKREIQDKDNNKHKENTEREHINKEINNMESKTEENNVLGRIRKARTRITGKIKKHKRYIVFSIGGVITFLLDIAITALLTEVLNIWYMGSYAVALFTNIILLFFYHSFITFKDLRKHFFTNFLKFMSTYSLAILLNWSLVFIITNLIKIHYLIVVAFVTISLSVLNYTLNKKWVFNIHKNIKREFDAEIDLDLIKEINMK